MKKGLTLIEMLVAMVITTIILGLTVTQFLMQRGHINIQENQIKLDRDTRLTLMFVAEELREIGLDPKKTHAFGINNGNTNSIIYSMDRNLNGIVEAAENGSILLIAGTLVFNGNNVLSNITALQLTYWSDSGVVIPVPPIINENDGTGYFTPEVALIDVTLSSEIRNPRGKLLAQSNQTISVVRKNR